MQKTILLFCLGAHLSCSSDNPPSPDDTPLPNTPIDTGSPTTSRTLATGLDTPWDLQLGPDGTLWVRERRDVISRIDTSNGEVTPVHTISDVIEISESGLLGMALHPNFDTDPFVYVVYSYSEGGIYNRLARMRWDGSGWAQRKSCWTPSPGRITTTDPDWRLVRMACSTSQRGTH